MRVAERILAVLASIVTLSNAFVAIANTIQEKARTAHTETPGQVSDNTETTEPYLSTRFMETLMNMNREPLPTRLVVVLILEGSLAYGFGILFIPLSYLDIKFSSIAAGCIALVSAWISLFNITAVQNSRRVSRRRPWNRG